VDALEQQELDLAFVQRSGGHGEGKVEKRPGLRGHGALQSVKSPSMMHCTTNRHIPRNGLDAAGEFTQVVT
jgi:hypothetical protein